MENIIFKQKKIIVFIVILLNMEDLNAENADISKIMANSK